MLFALFTSINFLVCKSLLIPHCWINCSERSRVAQLFVSLLAPTYHKVFSFFFNLVPDFLDDFSLKNLLEKDSNNFRSHNVPVAISFNLLHVKAFKVIFEVITFGLVNADVYFD
jgi:hypothetical protein